MLRAMTENQKEYDVMVNIRAVRCTHEDVPKRYSYVGTSSPARSSAYGNLGREVDTKPLVGAVCSSRVPRSSDQRTTTTVHDNGSSFPRTPHHQVALDRLPWKAMVANCTQSPAHLIHRAAAANLRRWEYLELSPLIRRAGDKPDCGGGGGI